ncbi:MAG: hypothetical protein NT154_01980 [Verrucomicrobia bacterium]|nr:hypothetical protein [Verrucomicrobiota bacterium]
MAWIYRRDNSGFWWIGTRANGRLICKSTGETKESKAKEQLATLEAMEAAQRAGRLNRDFFEALTGAHIEVKSLFDCLDTWIKETTNWNTRRNYEILAEQLKEAFPHNPPLLDISQEQIRSFMASVRAKNMASTANMKLACAKAFFGRFEGALRKDPTEGIPRFKREASPRECVESERLARGFRGPP